jgi:hypothetical protein
VRTVAYISGEGITHVDNQIVSDSLCDSLICAEVVEVVRLARDCSLYMIDD